MEEDFITVSDNDESLVVNIGIENPSFFDVGFLSSDMFHLILISELAADKRDEDIEKLYFRDYGNYRHPSRWDVVDYFREYYNSFHLEKLSLGSIEFGIALNAISALSGIIVPVSLFALERKLNRRNNTIRINIRSNSEAVHRLLKDMEENGVESLKDSKELIKEYLRHKNISIRETTERNLFEVVDRTINRMDSTVETIYEIEQKNFFDGLFK